MLIFFLLSQGDLLRILERLTTRISSRLRSDNIKPHRESRSLQAVQRGIFIDKGTVVIELSASRFLAHEIPPNCAVGQTNRHVR